MSTFQSLHLYGTLAAADIGLIDKLVTQPRFFVEAAMPDRGMIVVEVAQVRYNWACSVLSASNIGRVMRR